MITFSAASKFDKPVTVLFVDQSSFDQKKFVVNDAGIKNQILSLQSSKQFSAENGELFPLFNAGKILLLVGLGKTKELSSTALRITVRKAFLSSYVSKAQSLDVISHEDKEDVINTIIEGILVGTYSWTKYLTKEKDDKTIESHDKKITIVAQNKNSYTDTITICEGMTLTRNLINDNADTVTAEFVEEAIKELVAGKKQVSLEILGEKEMKAKGLGLHLAVNQGSDKPPRLIIVKYSGGTAKDPYTAIVGKGITFDTGGLNLKPTGSMETMRTDMSGSAAVVGTLKNVLALNIKKNILFVCAMAENSIDAKSFKCGDVLTSYSGKTVEIGNTDAEGRLVLADAISYIVKNYKPAEIIDLATLTGACVIALGFDYSGLMSNNDELANQLLKSAEATDDRIWRLPNYPEIKNYVKSKIADIKNVGLPRGAAGACTAAEFLRQFTEDTKWAHLDIAGTAFVDGGGRMYFGHGATGTGVRLLTHYLRNN